MVSAANSIAPLEQSRAFIILLDGAKIAVPQRGANSGRIPHDENHCKESEGRNLLLHNHHVFLDKREKRANLGVMKIPMSVSLLAIAAATAFAGNTPPTISGDYLEVRSCDVYTGPCFANAEMNLAGKEAMMLWSVREGMWKGTRLDGLNVMAVIRADGTLGDLKYQPRSGNAMLIVDANADARQKEALTDFARALSGKLLTKIVDVKSAPIDAKLATCSKQGCASVKAGELVEISTSCLGSKHDICGNEETFYPPLANVVGAYPVFTEVAAFTGKNLGCMWQIAGKRSAFLATFSTVSTPEPRSEVALVH